MRKPVGAVWWPSRALSAGFPGQLGLGCRGAGGMNVWLFVGGPFVREHFRGVVIAWASRRAAANRRNLDFSWKTCNFKPVCASRMSNAHLGVRLRRGLLQASKERVCVRTPLYRYLILKYCAPLVRCLVVTDGAGKTVTVSVVANQRPRLSSVWL